jgi:DNA-directed RNA polymerase specialized sigma24 family protein
LPVGRLEDLRDRYAAVRREVLWELWGLDPQEWATGEIGVHHFGSGADSLDALCLIAAYEADMRYSLAAAVELARYDGRSWSEIAAALGVSRQAATKRFRSVPETS